MFAPIRKSAHRAFLFPLICFVTYSRPGCPQAMKPAKKRPHRYATFG